MNTKHFLFRVLALWLACASQVTTSTPEPRSNWTSTAAPCAKYDDLRQPVLGNIGVRIDTAGPWADAFLQAFRFWNSVLVVNFHEDTILDTCAVRIIAGGPDILHETVVARTQLIESGNFRGMIAVSQRAATSMSSTELYGVAVHEFGHLLGLKHNPSIQSLMYYFDLNGTEVLDSKDMVALSSLHTVRPTISPTRFLPIPVRSEKPQPRKIRARVP